MVVWNILIYTHVQGLWSKGWGTSFFYFVFFSNEGKIFNVFFIYIRPILHILQKRWVVLWHGVPKADYYEALYVEVLVVVVPRAVENCWVKFDCGARCLWAVPSYFCLTLTMTKNDKNSLFYIFHFITMQSIFCSYKIYLLFLFYVRAKTIGVTNFYINRMWDS